MVAQKGIIQTILGNGEEGWDGDGGPALDAACQLPYACEFDSQGNMIVCMGRQNRIRRMDAGTGIITLVAGTGEGATPAMAARSWMPSSTNPTGWRLT